MDSVCSTRSPPHSDQSHTAFWYFAKAPTVSFKTLDDASVRDSVSSTMLKQTTHPKQEGWIPVEEYLAGKATAEEKGKFLDPMVGSTPPHMDFTAFVNGQDVSLVDKPADVATTSAGDSTPLTTAGGQVKIEVPPRYSGKDTRVSVCGSPRWSDTCG